MLNDHYDTQPFTEDVLTPITLYGRTFPVKDKKVTIPTRYGEATVTIVEEPKRKDWYYLVEYRGTRYIQVARTHLESALPLIIREDDFYAER